MVKVIKSAPVSARHFQLGRNFAAAVAGKSAETTSCPAAKPEQPAAPVVQQLPAADVKSDGQRIAELVAEQVKLELDSCLEEARQAWSEEAEHARESAMQRGYEEGLSKAAGQFELRQAEVERHLEDLCISVNAAVAAALNDVVDIASRVAFEALLKIVGDAGASGELVQRVVVSIMSQMEAQGSLLLRVHPDDAAVLAGRFEQVGETRVTLQADSQIARGGCMVETARGILDARMETQLEALLLALRGSPSSHPEAAV